VGRETALQIVNPFNASLQKAYIFRYVSQFFVEFYGEFFIDIKKLFPTADKVSYFNYKGVVCSNPKC
jgi:hypothetical protein